MSSISADPDVSYPIPISRVAHRYYLYNIQHITHLRRAHNIPGVLIGTLPQAPQQNVFLGLPLELMPEEARLLVENGVAYIVDDCRVHRNSLREMRKEDKRRWRQTIEVQGRDIARLAAQRQDERKQAALSKLSEDDKAKALASWGRSLENIAGVHPMPNGVGRSGDEDTTALFNSSAASEATAPHAQDATRDLEPYRITPTTSHPPFPNPRPSFTPRPEATPFSPFSAQYVQATEPLPTIPHSHSYEFYEHLHSRSYFMTPGLRFGAHYTVYPGDPLRFHSHFMADGLGWDEEVDLMRLVGGGRLGTGVKKGYLIGGKVEGPELSKADEDLPRTPAGGGGGGSAASPSREVRCFCIEWGGI